MDILQPPGWPRPLGYANGVAARGRLIFTAGIVGRDPNGPFPPDFVGQASWALTNILAVLAEAGAGAEHLVRLTWYIRDRREYLANQSELGDVYREVFGRHFPAMTMVEVAALIDDEARLEIEATAVVPDEDEDEEA